MTPATIDPDEDFASWYEHGGDPDRDCERLYRWHQSLWGRTFTGVGQIQMEVVRNGNYELEMSTAKGSRFRLGSDSIIATWSSPGWAQRYSFGADLIAEIAKDSNDFHRISSTIGGYIVFPRNGRDQTGPTINQARGVTPSIADRFDLTLECIRRHYDEPAADNPLGERLVCYREFFALFGSFDTYVRFFLLDDLLTRDRTAVQSLITREPIRGFTALGLPTRADQYARYRENGLAFVKARNGRIRQLSL